MNGGATYSATPEDRIEFVVFNSLGEIDSVDPVIRFLETDEAWYVTNPFHTYKVLRSPGRSYVLRQRADNVSHIIEELEKGKHA